MALIVVLLGTYFGSYRSLHVAVRRISDGFSEGVYYTDRSGNTFQHKSIRSQLINRVEACTNLVSVARNFTEAADEAEALRSVANGMKDSLYGNGTPAELCRQNKELGRTFDALYSALSPLELDSRDKDNMESAKLEMDSSADTIEISGYNESVREFDRSTLSVFPTNLLRHICFVKEPELFE